MGEDHYLGKHSVAHPIKLQYSVGDEVKRMSRPFMFGTGGAGWCLSRSLLRKTITEISKVGSFNDISSAVGAPDDVTIGFIVSELVRIADRRSGIFDRRMKFRDISSFHSHLENLQAISDLPSQVSLSYSEDVFENGSNPRNVVLLENRRLNMEE